MTRENLSEILAHFGFQLNPCGAFEQFLREADCNRALCSIGKSELRWFLPKGKEQLYLDAYAREGYPWTPESCLEDGQKSLHEYRLAARILDYEHMLTLVHFLQSGLVDTVYIDGCSYAFPDVLVSQFSVAHGRDSASELRLENFQKGLETNPNDAFLHNFIGKMYLAEGKVDEASHYFVNACEKEMKYAEPYSNMGALMWNNGEKQKAFRLFCESLMRNPFDETLQDNFIQAGIELNQNDEMNRCINLTMDYFPGYKGLKYLKATLLERMGKLDECRALLGEMAVENPDDERTRNYLTEMQSS